MCVRASVDAAVHAQPSECETLYAVVPLTQPQVGSSPAPSGWAVPWDPAEYDVRGGGGRAMDVGSAIYAEIDGVHESNTDDCGWDTRLYEVLRLAPCARAGAGIRRTTYYEIPTLNVPPGR